MAKYRYRIEAGMYGGEFVMGTVSSEFVKYWKPIIEENGASDTFIPHILSLNGNSDNLDPNSPNIFKDGNDIEGWSEVSDMEHLSAAYADNDFRVLSVPSDGSDDWSYESNDEVSCQPYILSNREGGYIESEGEVSEGFSPVMLFLSEEKGSFAAWFIDTDEVFDEKKLVITINETQMGEFIEDLAYDKVWIEPNLDSFSSRGKGYQAMVGWSKSDWRDSYIKPDENDEMVDCWNDYDAEMAPVIVPKVVPPINHKDEIEKIKQVCLEMDELDIGSYSLNSTSNVGGYGEWVDYLKSKGLNAKIGDSWPNYVEIIFDDFIFIIDNKDNISNFRMPSEICFIAGRFAGWINK